MSNETPLKSLFPNGWPQRLFFAWATVVVPTVCFVIVLSNLHLAIWQSPGLDAWIQLLVDRPGATGFAPIAAMVVLLCAAITFRPGEWVSRWYWRALIVVGILLGVQYTFLLPATWLIESPWPDVIVAYREWGVVLLVVFGLEVISLLAFVTLRYFYRRFGLRKVLLGLGLLYLAISLGIYFWNEGTLGLVDPENLPKAFSYTPIVLALFSILAGPLWATDSLCRLYLRLGEPKKLPLPATLSALVVYLASWRAALLLATEAYQALPTNPPTCFVATAAAQAPAWLAGSFEVETLDGGTLRVSPQLQRFKLFELALKTLSPAAHQGLRRVYDRIGPGIAARARTPARAALLWLALKPLETLAMLLLTVFAGSALRERALRQLFTFSQQ